MQSRHFLSALQLIIYILLTGGNMQQIIEVQNLSFAYPNRGQVLKDISFCVPKGQIVGLIGASGCGKSTLCLCLAGIIPHSIKGKMKGKIWIDSKDVMDCTLPQLAQKIGMVFQDPDTQLFCPTVEDELAFAPENLCIPPGEIQQRVSKTLKMIDIEHLRYRNPSQLSGGEKHLVALGAVLTLDPDILIFDEVMPRLDEAGKSKIEQVIMQLKSQGKTIVMVEHHPGYFLHMIDRGIVLENGKIIYQGLEKETIRNFFN